MSEHATRIVILGSGDRTTGQGGSTMKQFIEDTQNHVVDAEVVGVICNNSRDQVPGFYNKIDAANDDFGLDIRTIEINNRLCPDGPQSRGISLAASLAICEFMTECEAENALCLGFMPILNGDFIEEYGWKPEYAQKHPIIDIYMSRIANTHPGILPETADTYGIHASERVIELGLTETAHTLHVVGAGVDTGPTIAEHRVPVEPGVSARDLFDRVHEVELAMIGPALNRYYADQKIIRSTLGL